MARPRTNPEKHRQNVAITLDPDILLRSRALAAAKGKSLSQLLEDLLKDWIAEEEPSDEEMEGAIDAFIENHERREAAREDASRATRKKTAAPRK